jgi:hypothetical protein
MSLFIYWLQVKRECSCSVYKEHLHQQRQRNGLYTIFWMKYKLSNSMELILNPIKHNSIFFHLYFQVTP